MATEHKRSTNGQRKSYFSSGRCRYRSFSRRLRGFMTFSRNRVKKRLWLVVDFSWRHSFSLTPLTLWRQTRAQSHKKVTDENTRLVLDNYSLSSVQLQSVLLITPVAAAGFHCCLWLDTKLWHEMRLARDEEGFFFFPLCADIQRPAITALSPSLIRWNENKVWVTCEPGSAFHFKGTWAFSWRGFTTAAKDIPRSGTKYIALLCCPWRCRISSEISCCMYSMLFSSYRRTA